MLENQSKKILLLSNNPADASFLSEIAVTQQAELVLALDASDLCSKIAESRADHSLAAIFVDVSMPLSLRKFEHELQSNMGFSLANDLSSIVHFISSVPLALNREVLQCPYFSFYSERKNYDFAQSAPFYQHAFYKAAEFLSSPSLGFDSSTRSQCFEKIKKELLLQDASVEWAIKFKNAVDEMLEQLFPTRFEASIQFSKQTFKITFSSSHALNRNQFRVENFLNLGVSSIISPNILTLIFPVFQKFSDSGTTFKFYRIES